MSGNSIRIILSGILVCMMLLFGCPQYLHGDGLHVAMTHHLFHANVMHLAVNCLSIWTLFRRDVRYGLTPLVFAYVIGTVSWYFTHSDPVGFSNIIFAIIGLRTPSLSNGWWKQSVVIVFLAVTALMALLPQVSAVTHIVSFVLGCLAAGAQRIIVSIGRDYRRATYNQ